MKTLPLLMLVFFIGCNSLSGHIEQQVGSNVETVKHEMDTKVEKTKRNFIEVCQAAEKSNNAYSQRQNLQTFQATIASANHYLDSLKSEMDKLDDIDVHNVELVRSTFLYKGAGDSIISKWNAAVIAAQQVATTEKQKAAIRAVKDSLAITPNPTWNKQAFGMTGPLGASMVLYGLRMELYRMGIETLKN